MCVRLYVRELYVHVFERVRERERKRIKGETGSTMGLGD